MDSRTASYGPTVIRLGLLARWFSTALALDAFLTTVLVNVSDGFIMLTNEDG